MMMAVAVAATARQNAAKYFQTSNGKALLNYFLWQWFFRSLLTTLLWKTKTNNVRVRLTRYAIEWVHTQSVLGTLSCHKSGTSFRFLMILFLLSECVPSIRWPRTFFFYDSFVYDRNIHLTTSFRMAAAAASGSPLSLMALIIFFSLLNCIGNESNRRWTRCDQCSERKNRREFAREKNELSWRMERLQIN